MHSEFFLTVNFFITEDSPFLIFYKKIIPQDIENSNSKNRNAEDFARLTTKETEIIDLNHKNRRINMKKYASMALVLVLTLSMAGCFRRNDTKPTETMTMPTGNYTTEPTTRATQPSTQSTTPSTQATVPSTTEGSAEGGTNGGSGSGAQGGGESGTTGRSSGNGGIGGGHGGM
jgi:uncharacterized membrane protein YgcG